MEKHVSSLELSKEFAEICRKKGIVVPWTEYVWVPNTETGGLLTFPGVGFSLLENIGKWECTVIPAPLVSEQGEWLPARIVLQTKLLKKEESVVLYYIKYEDDASDCDGTNLEDCVKTKWTVECGKEIIRETTEANARQKMLNYLIAEGVITNL